MPTQPISLTGQVIVITGASSGIGAATAKNLAQAGMKLVLTARREDRLRALADACGGATIVPGDITDPALPQRVLDAALKAHGRCDVLFNNAGLLETGPIEAIDLERVCHMVRVNVEAAFRAAYVFLRHFKSVNAGHLLNTSSVAGTKVRATIGPYAATKYAIEALSESLRMELAKTPIKVTCIEPGVVTTELHQRWATQPAQALGIAQPITADDIAEMIRYLLQQPAHIRIPRMMVLPTGQEF